MPNETRDAALPRRPGTIGTSDRFRDAMPWWRRAARLAMVPLTAIGGASFAYGMHWPEPTEIFCGLVFLAVFWMAAGLEME